MHSFLREVPCPTCGEYANTVIYPSNIDFEKIKNGVFKPVGHYGIVRCRRCGLIRSNPVFTAELIKRLYEEADTTNTQQGEEDNVRWTMRSYYRLIQPLLLGRERMLEVGCDLGFFLEAAAEDGFRQLLGIEPNPLARSRVEKVPGAVVTGEFYEEQDYADNHFDLIAAIHVLDHMQDARLFFERTLRQLRPGGVLLAVVHNVDSLLRRLLGERFPVFDLLHTYFFSRKTLRALGQTVGYDVKDVISTKNVYSLPYYTKKCPFLPEFLRTRLATLLAWTPLGNLSIGLRLGNIAIIAQRPPLAA